MRQRDRETRERLLKAAVQLFGERGFKKVTVREICRAARANVAAVNYHFGDKGGLYREVLQSAIEVVRATNDAARAASAGLPADERLRQYIRVSLCRAAKSGGAPWISRLVHREMTDPTPYFDTFIEQGIRPRLDDLAAIVAEMLACAPEHPNVIHCVTSIHAQWILFAPNPITSRLKPRLSPRGDDAVQMAAHIAEFSVAGIKAVAGAANS